MRWVLVPAASAAAEPAASGFAPSATLHCKESGLEAQHGIMAHAPLLAAFALGLF
jgi:hypothetical protein